MATWAGFRAEAPDLADAARRRVAARSQLTMGTLRTDGTPRISAVESRFVGAELWIAGMSGARKFVDLGRDPRLTLHSGIDDSDTWTGEAKITGRAFETQDGEQVAAFSLAAGEAAPGPFQLFRVEVREVTVVRIGDSGDHLVIEAWQLGVGLSRSVRRIIRSGSRGSGSPPPARRGPPPP